MLLAALPEPLIPLPLGLAALALAWTFCLGACVGSFLNVVIYRLPLGRSIVSPGSRCPACGKDIRWYDNLPVLSWFVLRGRCRDCGVAFSFRYPLVEFIVALHFAALAAEFLLPGGPWWVMNYSHAELRSFDLLPIAAAFAYYQLLICTLLAAALIAYDGQRAPFRLFAPAILAGLIVPAMMNEVRPFGVQGLSALGTVSESLKVGALGAFTGFATGQAIDRIRLFRNSAGEPRGRVTLMAVTVGWMLSWQAAALAVIVGGIIAILLILATSRRWRVASAAAPLGMEIASVVIVYAFGAIEQHSQAFLNWQDRRLFVVALVSAIAIGYLIRLIDPRATTEVIP